jgi:multiple sugar transport system substrate-binding protein
VTWKHDRGLAPMLATAAQFRAEHPDVTIQWDARSLEDFGHFSVIALAERYDLAVIDHPFMGQVARERCFLPLDDLVDETDLQLLAASSAGASHESYHYAGRQWALAIDAACQVSGFRPDLLDQAGATVPQTWEQVLALAKIRQGFVSMPLSPVDALITFFTLCANCGRPPFESEDRVAEKETGQYALELLQALARHSIEGSLSANPIAIWGRMSSTEEIAYCPLAFGYSNYARSGYRRSTISFTDIPSTGGRGPSGSTLGGAGLAISSKCKQPDIAAAYMLWVAGEQCQRTTYIQMGGQPAHRAAWVDAEANRVTNGFFSSTLATLEAAWMRPRDPGFVDFQERAAKVIYDFLRNERSISSTLQALEALYRSRRTVQSFRETGC